MNIRLILKRFFLISFPLGKKANKDEREFKRILKTLKKSEPRIFNPLSDTLQPLMGSYLYELEEATIRFKGVYKATIQAIDKQRVDNTRLGLINSLLKARSLNLKNFTFFSINEEVSKIQSNIENAEDHIFKTRYAFFRGKFIKQIQIAYNENEHLAQLSSFDFAGFISLFSPYSKDEETEIVYSECDGQKALPYLKDLYYLVGNFTPIKQTMSLFKIINTLLPNSSFPEDEILKDYAKLQVLLETAFDAETLLNIIRILSKNPSTQPNTLKVKEKALIEIGKQIAQQYNEDKNEYLKEKAEAELRKSVQSLFGEYEIIPVEGYSSEMSASLRRFQLPGYLYITPLRLLKTFLLKFYYGDIHSTFETVYGEMEFLNPEYQVKLLEVFKRISLLGDELIKFEEDLNSPDFWDLRPYIQKAEKGSQSEKEKKQAIAMVNQINKKADQIIQSVFTSFNTISGYNTQMMMDIRSKDSIILANGMFLTRNKTEMVYHYEKAIEIVQQFISILKLFSINISETKSKL